MVTINGLPVYTANVFDIEDGIFKVAICDNPAIESNFYAFSKQKEQLKYSIQDEEQRIVLGCLMRNGFPIYRRNDDGFEYYILYTKETIEQMASKWLASDNVNNIDLNHIYGTDQEGIYLMQAFIKDSSKGIDPIGFQDIEDGSLFAQYKVMNDNVWEAIKNGTYIGFSIEGLFTIEPMQEYTKYNKYNKNTIMNKLFNRFLKSFVKCGSVETDKGTLYWVGEADLQIGDELFYNTENEEAVKVEDGEYTLKDGTVIVVKEGLVSEIREKDGEQEGELDMEKKQCMEEEVIVEDPVEEVVEDKPRDDRYDELKRDIDNLRKEHDELKGIVKSLKDTINAILEKPAAEPIVEEFNKVVGSKVENGIPVFGSRAKRFN